MTTMASVAFLVLLGQSPAVSAEDFARLVDAELSRVTDISFLYEGEYRWLASARMLGRPVESFSENYQGTVILRLNGAGYAEVMTRPGGQPSIQRNERLAQLDGQYEHLSWSPDRTPDPRDGLVVRGPAPDFALTTILNRPHFLEHWFHFMQLKRDPGEWGYKFISWEALRGRRCLRFRLNVSPTRPEPDPHEYLEYWIDVERGCHPLRVDRYAHGKLWWRVEDFKLESFMAPDGSMLWLPVHAEQSSYMWDEKYSATPVYKQVVGMVRGTLQLNRNLPDALFTADRKGGLPTPDELNRLRTQKVTVQKLKKQEIRRPSNRQPMDPASVRQRLDRRLAQAQEQAKQLEASSPARETWSATTLFQGAFAVLGASLIVAAAVWRLRSR
jgi:hypothetical protein